MAKYPLFYFHGADETTPALMSAAKEAAKEQGLTFGQLMLVVFRRVVAEQPVVSKRIYTGKRRNYGIPIPIAAVAEMKAIKKDLQILAIKDECDLTDLVHYALQLAPAPEN